MGVHGAELTDADSGEVHVYAHPSKPVINLKQQKEKDKVQGLMFKATGISHFQLNSSVFHDSILETPNTCITHCMLSSFVFTTCFLHTDVNYFLNRP